MQTTTTLHLVQGRCTLFMDLKYWNAEWDISNFRPEHIKMIMAQLVALVGRAGNKRTKCYLAPEPPGYEVVLVAEDLPRIERYFKALCKNYNLEQKEGRANHGSKTESRREIFNLSKTRRS
jgi:hypothetical protein